MHTIVALAIDEDTTRIILYMSLTQHACNVIEPRVANQTFTRNACTRNIEQTELHALSVSSCGII